MIKQTKDKYTEYKKGGWGINRGEGKNDINIRDIAYKILTSPLSFKGVIDSVVSFDPPGHGNYTLTFCYFATAEVKQSQLLGRLFLVD